MPPSETNNHRDVKKSSLNATDEALIDDLNKLLQQGIATGVLHGMVVAAGSGAVPDLLWAGGDAAVQPTRRAMAVDAVFDIASITKVVATSTACGICIDQGLLDPDAPVLRYLPECVQPPGPVLRVRDLATHTSGFADEKFAGLPGDELLHQILTAPASWPAGQHYQYTCRNFVLLGLIVERLVGQTLGEFCQTHIFQPLEMTCTSTYPLPTPLYDMLVPGNISTGPDRVSMYKRVGRMLGHAGLYSTASDLARFCAMMLGGGSLDGITILHEPAMNWLTKPCGSLGSPDKSFGYDMRPPYPPGTVVTSEDPYSCPHASGRPEGLSSQAYGHGGWTGHHLWIDPGLGLYMIILTNRTHRLNFQANGLASRLLRRQVGDVLLRHAKATEL
jgi:CubicO group peptidase (beta-lactamase class C family)